MFHIRHALVKAIRSLIEEGKQRILSGGYVQSQADDHDDYDFRHHLLSIIKLFVTIDLVFSSDLSDHNFSSNSFMTSNGHEMDASVALESIER